MRIARILLVVACLSVVGVGVTGCGGNQPNDDSMDTGGLNVAETLAGLITHTQQVMSKVTDLSSAQRAKVKLKRISQDYDDFIDFVSNISEKRQDALAVQARKALPQLRGVAAQIREVPALNDIIGVELKEITAKLAQLQ